MKNKTFNLPFIKCLHRGWSDEETVFITAGVMKKPHTCLLLYVSSWIEVSRRCRLVRQKGKEREWGREREKEGRYGGREDRDSSALQPAWRRG
jgi:hypothetical protein